MTAPAPMCTVSVPSRGNGVIDYLLGKYQKEFAKVSVPSRGNGVIDPTA